MLTAKIEAIDKTTRQVTLKDKDGEMETIKCGPEVKRFDELKVGDTVTFRYYESIAYAIRKPGQPSGMPTQTGPSVTRGQGPKPGGTISQQETATVTLQCPADPRSHGRSSPDVKVMPSLPWRNGRPARVRDPGPRGRPESPDRRPAGGVAWRPCPRRSPATGCAENG